MGQNIKIYGKLEAVTTEGIIAGYNQLSDQPIVNADLSANGQTWTNNTYYRHIGTTSDNYTNGIIYVYNGTDFKEIGVDSNVLLAYNKVESIDTALRFTRINGETTDVAIPYATNASYASYSGSAANAQNASYANNAAYDSSGHLISDIYNRAENAYGLAVEKQQSIGKASYNELTTYLNNISYAGDPNFLRVGQSIYIATMEVPDAWVYSISENYLAYNYTNDNSFVEALVSSNGLQIGYFILKPLESAKVDLTNYYTKAQTAEVVVSKINELDVSDSVVSAQYVSGVSETDGKISVIRANLPTEMKNPYAITFDNGGVVASCKTYDGSETKTIAASDVGAYTKAEANSAITNAINNLNSNVTTTAADSNQYSVLTSVTETNGKLTSKTEVKLAAVAKTGLMDDLSQGTDTYIVFDCGTSTILV